MPVGNAVRNPLSELGCHRQTPRTGSRRTSARTAVHCVSRVKLSATAASERRDDIRRAVADG